MKTYTIRNDEMDWPSSPSTITAEQKGYLYNYNRNNWLTEAKFGDAANNGAISVATTKHREQGLEYDANGNITRLQRTNENSDVVDDLAYEYSYSGTNRLNHVTDSADSSLSTTDIDTQSSGNYIYNVLGQLILNTEETTHYVYNTQGLVTEVRQGDLASHLAIANVVQFFYNEHGHRIRKEVYQNNILQNTTYYVLDTSGNAMAIYYRSGTGTIAQTELPIYGASRLGVYMKSSNAKNYQITDHLGNVRAVAQRAVGSNIVTTLSYADYYPFGEQLQGRSSASNYRYAYQGQEKDPETGMEAFQLRMWDGRLGRWLSPDPYGQYASPYLGMGNDPINLIDPDGGQTDDWYRNKSGNYVWKPGSTADGSVIAYAGLEWIGENLGDVMNHYNANTNWLTRLFSSPKFGDTTGWSGEIRQTGWFDAAKMNFEHWREKDKKDLDAILGIGVELTYGTADNAAIFFTGWAAFGGDRRGLSGKRYYGDSGLNKSLDGMVTVASFGASLTFTATTKLVKSTPKLWNSYRQIHAMVKPGTPVKEVSKAYQKALLMNHQNYFSTKTYNIFDQFTKGSTFSGELKKNSND